MNSYTNEELQFMFDQGFRKAENACNAYLAQYGDHDCCGFAWVIIDEFNGKKIDGRQKIAKQLYELECITRKELRVWNPSKSQTQSLSALEAGARAFAKHLNDFGFHAYMDSRVD